MKEICRSPRRTLVGDRNQHERVRAHSHEHIVNNIMPQMAEFDLSYHPSNMKSVNSDNRELYVDIEQLNTTMKLVDLSQPQRKVSGTSTRITMMKTISRHLPDMRVLHTQQKDNRYRAGGMLNKVLRHHIGRYGDKYTGGYPLSCMKERGYC